MPSGEICILAGGLSRRMGCDKSGVRVRGKTLLRHVRDIARQTCWPVRVIRRDLVARCGPLGGVYTALKTTRADAVLFLACDMPFITVELLEKLMKSRLSSTGAIFTRHEGEKAGFPFLLGRDLLAEVGQELALGRRSLPALAKNCRASLFRPSTDQPMLINVNSPSDLMVARKVARMLLSRRRGARRK